MYLGELMMMMSYTFIYIYKGTLCANPYLIGALYQPILIHNSPIYAL